MTQNIRMLHSDDSQNTSPPTFDTLPSHLESVYIRCFNIQAEFCIQTGVCVCVHTCSCTMHVQIYRKNLQCSACLVFVNSSKGMKGVKRYSFHVTLNSFMLMRKPFSSTGRFLCSFIPEQQTACQWTVRLAPGLWRSFCLHQLTILCVCDTFVSNLMSIIKDITANTYWLEAVHGTH
jgi:hypothetical protein